MTKPIDVETHFNAKYRQFDSFYNEKKGWHARIIDNTFRKSMHLRFEKVIHDIAPYPGKTVLDIGCGAGRYSLALAHQGIEKALGIDFAQNMISQAQQQANHQKVANICEFQRNDFMSMAFTQFFDHSFAMGVMDYIEDPVAFVNKAVQITRLSVMLSFPSAGGFIQWARRHYFYRIKKCPVFFYRKKDIEHIVDSVGIQHYTIDRLAKDYFLTLYIDEKSFIR